MGSLSLTATRSRSEWQIIAFFIFAFAAGGVIQPFLNLYLVEVGLSGTQIGILQGWTALIAVLITPLIGILTDRTQRHRWLLGINVLLKGISAPLMLLSSAWAWLLGVVSLRIITAGAQDALMNRLTIAHLQNNGQTNFGAVRFWGALSFAATSLLAGIAARETSAGVLFPLAGVFALVAVIFVRAFPARIAEKSEPVNRSRPRRTLFDPALVSLYLVIFIFSFSRSGYETFNYVFLTNQLGANYDLIGVLGAIGGIAPVPAFYLADRCHHQWGQTWTMALGLFFFLLSYAGFALLTNPIWGIPLVVFYGFGTALFLVSMVLMLGQIGHPEQAATNQMLAQLTVPGLAGIFALPVSGWLFDYFGGRFLFSLDAVLILFAFLFLFAHRLKKVE
jgi:MFS transporter, PPP family, 3-phenylpropionic acid transporter